MKEIKIFLIFISPLFIGWFALFLGAYKISPFLIIKILIDNTFHIFHLNNTPENVIVIDIRLPRVLLAGLVGIALSCTGAVLQGIFRNPLIDPYILGISSGAAFGCAMTIGFLGFIPLQVNAFIFAVLAVFFTYSIAKVHGEITKLSLILSGIIVSAFFTALVSIIKFLVDPHKLQAIVYWIMGSFSLADWSKVKVALIGISIGIIPLYFMRWRLNVISMGEEEAKALGVDVKKERLLFIGFSTLAVATATSVSGIIGWVGLMVPHLVRMVVGPDHKLLIPLSATAGASFMIIADTLARSLTTFDIPVGIITALTGAPFFVYLMKYKSKEVWGRHA